MIIENMETFILSDKLKKSFYFSHWSYDKRQTCVVKITTETGLKGWGEVYCPANVLKKGIKLIKSLLMRKDPIANENLWFEMYRRTLDFARRGALMASISDVDMKLWDIKGKAMNLPVSTLLGGQLHT